jgi:hypothetical protein
VQCVSEDERLFGVMGLNYDLRDAFERVPPKHSKLDRTHKGLDQLSTRRFVTATAMTSVWGATTY